MYDLNSTMTVPVKPYRVKEGTKDVSFDVYKKIVRRWSSPLPTFSLIIKMWPSLFLGLRSLAHLLVSLTNVLCWETHSLPIFLWWDKRTWTSVIDTRWAASIKRQWLWVPSYTRDCRFKSQSEFQLGSRPSLWVQVPSEECRFRT